MNFYNNFPSLYKKILSMLLLAPFGAFAESSDSLTFTGTLSVASASTYTYKLVIAPYNGKWAGYTLLDEGGINETKSSVGVQFSKEKGGMILAEKALLFTRSKEQAFCFVNAVLRMSGKNEKKILKGMFIGRDKSDQFCGNGNLRFNVPDRAQLLMTPDGSKDTNLNKVVTSFMSQDFTVGSTQVQLELWDGGANDHDSLSVYLNGSSVGAPFEITSEKRTLQLDLKSGNNIVHIKALNEGTRPPNSARITIVDGATRYSVVSYLKTGQQATVKLKRK
ncbi:MAG: hypothetical protein QM743_13185 [Chitinophagaceae bacterium]